MTNALPREALDRSVSQLKLLNTQDHLYAAAKERSWSRLCSALFVCVYHASGEDPDAEKAFALLGDCVRSLSLQKAVLPWPQNFRHQYRRLTDLGVRIVYREKGGAWLDLEASKVRLPQCIASLELNESQLLSRDGGSEYRGAYLNNADLGDDGLYQGILVYLPDRRGYSGLSMASLPDLLRQDDREDVANPVGAWWEQVQRTLPPLKSVGAWVQRAKQEWVPREASGSERRFNFACYGPHDGQPVLVMHGLLGSRFEWPNNPAMLARLGIRLIIPERPGYGGSDWIKHYDWHDHIDDVMALLDRAGIERCYLLAHCAGAAYALALAQAHPHRIAGLAVVSPLPDRKAWVESDQHKSLMQRTLQLLHRSPALGVSLAYAALNRSLDLLSDDDTQRPLPTWLSAKDRDYLSTIDVRQHVARHFQQARCQGATAWTRSLKHLVESWSLKEWQVSIPVKLWVGESDAFITQGLLNRWGRVSDQVQVHRVPDETRGLYFRQFESVLQDLLGA